MALSLKPHISYLDKSFKESHTRSYIMAMQINRHGLVLSLYNPDRNKFIGLQQYRFDEKKEPGDFPVLFDLILNNQPWFAFPYMDFYCLVQNSFYTLIPLPLFKKEHKNLYLGFNHPFQENHRIVFDELKNTGSANVYYLPNPLAEKVKEFWPNARIIHYSTALIESLTVNFKNKLDANTIFLDAHEESFDLVYFKENRLFYANNFVYQTKEDFAYFLLSAMEQLSLNPEEVQLQLMGNIDKEDEKYQLIYQYIRQIDFIETNKNFHYSYLLDNVRKHKFHTLFNVLQCEL
jgi:hypothetical protein